MLRATILAGILVASSAFAQQAAKKAPSTRGLDAAALTPFFTKRGAESVKRVVRGADELKAEEAVAYPDNARSRVAGAGGNHDPLITGMPGASAQEAPPPPEPVFAWHLVGISYGSHRGIAMFKSADGKIQSMASGSRLDADTIVKAVRKGKVELSFRGRDMQITPW